MLSIFLMGSLRTLAPSMALGLMTAAAASQTTPAPIPPQPVPDAPQASAPAKPSFALPPTTYEVPKPAPAFKPKPQDDSYCYAPPEGIYRRTQDVPPALKGPLHSYVQLVYAQIFGEWERHMTVAERNAWGKGKMVAVRFAILPDGSYERPVLTLSSGKDKYDARALDAVNSQASFPTPPSGWNKPLPLCIVIGYHMDSSQMQLGRNDAWQEDPSQKQP